MTDEAAKQLTVAVQDTKAQIEEVKRLLIGDKLKQIPGLIDVIDQHRTEIYGDKSRQHIGLKEAREQHDGRIRSLEADRIKFIAITGGVSSIVALLWLLAKQFIFH